MLRSPALALKSSLRKADRKTPSPVKESISSLKIINEEQPSVDNPVKTYRERLQKGLTGDLPDRKFERNLDSTNENNDNNEQMFSTLAIPKRNTLFRKK